jgi:hypothetical protein
MGVLTSRKPREGSPRSSGATSMVDVTAIGQYIMRFSIGLVDR